MNKLLISSASALALLALSVTAHAASGDDRTSAAASGQSALQLAQAPGGAPGAAPGGMPSADDVGKMKKRAKSGKKPTKAEMEKIKQHVPKEYHQYLNFR
jgi:hypothetical protein